MREATSEMVNCNGFGRNGHRPPVIALPKGRLLETAVDFLEKVGIEARQVLAGSADRRLTFLNDSGKKTKSQAQAPGFIIVKPHDVVQFVHHGAADLGIVGNDVLREQELPVFEPLDLRFGVCRLVLAGTEETKKWFEERKLLSGGAAEEFMRLRIATCYPHICQQWAQKKNLDVQIRPLYGSVEIAPITGFSDLIMDLVSSGETLRQNGLKEITTVLDISARLIVNRAALKTRPDLATLIGLMKKSLSKKVSSTRI